MLFNSIPFLIFFPIVLISYFALPNRFRWAFLLGSSYYFYMCWKPEYIVLILLSTLVDYYSGQKIHRAKQTATRRLFLILSLTSNLGMLLGFKYLNFFNAQIRSVFESANIFYGIESFDLLLPVGISFYTFQTLSYTIDIYRGNRNPESHFGRFALYVSFFPQLVAGPIERSERLLPQFWEKHDFDYNRVTDGLKLMVWGFFKKLVIADRLSVYVNQIYNSPGEFHGAPVILATYFFAFQIYCDFSGYSDIAIGAAQTMGYKLMDNFKRPYYSKSIGEFWRRWHISLSSWFKDYVYIPLGGSRGSKLQHYNNLMIVFLLSGLWHGANWTFLAWGALHGSYLITSHATKSIRERILHQTGMNRRPGLHRWVQVFLTFHFVLLGWVIFRANSLSEAWILLQSMFTQFSWKVTLPEFALYDLVLAAAALIVLEGVHLVQRNVSLRLFLRGKNIGFRWTVYYAATMSIVYFGKYASSQEFVYFQF